MFDSRRFIFPNHQEFLAFLYIHMASADLIIEDDEVAVIKQKLGNLLPQPQKPEEVYEEIKGMYDELDLEQIDIVLNKNFERHGKSLVDHKSIFNDLYAIVVADGYIEEGESRIIERIKQLMNDQID